MLNEQEIVGLLEGTLPAEQRARLVEQIANDPAARGALREQTQMDNVLRVVLGDAAAHERVKQSVLAVVRGGSEEAIKQQVLHDTAVQRRSSGGNEAQTETEIGPRRFPSAAARLLALFRRPAWAFGFAAVGVCLGLGVWFVPRTNRPPPAQISYSLETPLRVDFPSGTAYFPNHPTADTVQSFRDTGSLVPKGGDGLRVGETGSATLRFADGTVLHLEPGTEVRFQPVANPPRAGGKQFKLLAGTLAARVVNQPDGWPLLIETPHALVTVVGTEFELAVATNRTELEVTHGLVKLARSGAEPPVSVATGEFAVAAPNAEMRYGRLPRNPHLWPFSSASVWNRPLGSGAKFSPVPGRPFLADGPLTNAMRPRRPFIGSPADPLRRIWVKGEPRADVRLAAGNLPGAGRADAFVLLQHGRRFAFELREVTVRADGDLDAADAERMWLNGPGTSAHPIPALPFGLSNLGGLIRAGEIANGIPHALSARVSRLRLAGREFLKPVTTWPATGNPVGETAEPYLAVGSLLAIPPDVDLRELAGESGALYELARAMQDYGVYVTGFIDAPFVLLTGEVRLADADELLNQLVPLLQIVTNNTPEAPGGGGTPRRPAAPALPGETK